MAKGTNVKADHNGAPSGTKMCSKCRIAGSGRGNLTQLAAVICCFRDWRTKKKKEEKKKRKKLS